MVEIKRDNKILVYALIVVLLTSLLVRFDITGKVVDVFEFNSEESEDSIVIINPKSVKNGQLIEVKIIPGGSGIKNRYAWVYVDGKEPIMSSGKTICGERRVCYDESKIIYEVERNWYSGRYTIRVYENRFGEEYSEAEFYVVS